MMKKLLVLFVALVLLKNTYAQSGVDTSINYTYNKPISIEAESLKAYLLKNDFKHRVKKAFETNTFNQTAVPVPQKYADEFKIDTAKIAGCTVYTLAPKNNPSGKIVLYLHGGAYVFGISDYHWDLAAELVRKTNATILIPDYPLAPRHTVHGGFAMMEQLYKHLLSKASANSIIFLGDSAGGGLALAFAEQLNKEGGPQPSQIILLSPWLDVTMTNPGIKAITENDPVLEVAGLHMAAKAWAGKLYTKNFWVSPIYGNLKGLARISVFIGGGDSLMPDAAKFKSMMEKKQILINYFYYPQMIHDWAIVTFTPEAKQAIEQISMLINND